MQYMQKQSVFILSGTYLCPNSIQVQVVSTKKVTKKEEQLNLNPAESSEAKSIAFPVSLC